MGFRSFLKLISNTLLHNHNLDHRFSKLFFPQDPFTLFQIIEDPKGLLFMLIGIYHISS